jgi:hypothetical protein
VPRVVIVGYPAIIHSLQVLSEHAGSRLKVVRNSVSLEPGAVWERNNVLLSADARMVQYARGDTVFEDETLTYLAETYDASMKRPLWMAMTPAQLRQVFGLAHNLSPWWGPRGSVSAWLDRFGTYYVQHRPSLELAMRQAALLLDGLFGLRPLWTSLFLELVSSMGSGGRQVFERWIKPADASPFVGILMGSDGPARIDVTGLEKAIAALRETPTEEFQSCVSVPMFAMLVRRVQTSAASLAPTIGKLRAEL